MPQRVFCASQQSIPAFLELQFESERVKPLSVSLYVRALPPKGERERISVKELH